jgi:hypothetical protein
MNVRYDICHIVTMLQIEQKRMDKYPYNAIDYLFSEVPSYGEALIVK